MNNNEKDNEKECCETKSVEDAIKIIFTIAISVMCVLLCGFILFCIYQTGITTESIISMLLAFFSIFISIFFYFKADESNNRFYINSYNFMKEQSDLLGRIDERFTEKIESLILRIDHLESGKFEKETELSDKAMEINDTIERLINAFNTSDNSSQNQEVLNLLQKYRDDLSEKGKEYNEIMESLQDIRQEVYRTVNNAKSPGYMAENDVSTRLRSFFSKLNRRDLGYLLKCGGRIQSSHRTFNMAKKYNLCDEKGWMFPELEMALSCFNSHFI